MKSEFMLTGTMQQRKFFTWFTPLSRVESKTKGTMILRYSGRFYKVVKVKSQTPKKKQDQTKSTLQQNWDEFEDNDRVKEQ